MDEEILIRSQPDENILEYTGTQLLPRLRQEVIPASGELRLAVITVSGKVEPQQKHSIESRLGTDFSARMLLSQRTGIFQSEAAN